MTDFSDLVAKSRADFPDNSPETIAIDVLAQLKVSTKASQILAPIVATVIAAMDRTEVRGLERRTFLRTPKSDLTDAIAARSALMEKGFIVGGEYIIWADATIAQHQARIEELRGKVDGLERTISVHEAAITAIRKGKGTCLGDVK